MAGYLDTLVGDATLRKRMGAKSLEIIAKHDRTLVLDQWEALYHRLSNEFIEAKERKFRQRMERKHPDYVRPRIHLPHIVRAGKLGLDQRFFAEEQWRKF